MEIMEDGTTILSLLFLQAIPKDSELTIDYGNDYKFVSKDEQLAELAEGIANATPSDAVPKVLSMWSTIYDTARAQRNEVALRL
jgi:hypothetical protein